MESEPINSTLFSYRIETIGDETNGLVWESDNLMYTEVGVEFDIKGFHYFVPFNSILFIKRNKDRK